MYGEKSGNPNPARARMKRTAASATKGDTDPRAKESISQRDDRSEVWREEVRGEK